MKDKIIGKTSNEKESGSNSGLNENSLSLIEGIMKQAEAEAEKIIREAKEQVERRLKDSEAQAKEILKKASKRADELARGIENNFRARTTVEVRRLELKAEDELFGLVIDMVRKKINELTSSANYRGILKGWITEAAIGLDTEEAFVNFSPVDAVDEKLLRECEREFKRIMKREIKLKISKEPRLKGQGVVLKDGGGKLSYNNQVETRIYRDQDRIRKLVYGELNG